MIKNVYKIKYLKPIIIIVYYCTIIVVNKNK